MSHWLEIGQDQSQFWQLTPRLVFLTIEAAARRLEREHNDRAWLAWHVAALTRVKKMPKLQSLTVKRRRRRPQTWQEQLAICKMITAYHGGSR